jgi:hypothetical protein
VSDRYRAADNSLPTKHVVAAGLPLRDAGSTPAASTNLFLNEMRDLVDFLTN